MCTRRGRQISSNNAVLADPLEETKETYCIAKELEIKCDVPGLPNTITQKVVDGFVDPALEHNNKKGGVRRKEESKDRDYDSQIDGPAKKRKMEICPMAMQVYCDF